MLGGLTRLINGGSTSSTGTQTNPTSGTQNTNNTASQPSTTPTTQPSSATSSPAATPPPGGSAYTSPSGDSVVLSSAAAAQSSSAPSTPEPLPVAPPSNSDAGNSVSTQAPSSNAPSTAPSNTTVAKPRQAYTYTNPDGDSVTLSASTETNPSTLKSVLEASSIVVDMPEFEVVIPTYPRYANESSRNLLEEEFPSDEAIGIKDDNEGGGKRSLAAA